MKIHTSKSIWTSKKAYFFLKEISCKSKGLEPLPKDGIERLWNHIKSTSHFKNGQVEITDNSFSFGAGTYESRWRDVSVDEIVELLEANGFKYREGKTVEYINL